MPEETDRQRLLALLREGERSPEELSRALDLPPRELAAELAHVDRSLRRRGGRLRVRPPVCRACGFTLRPTAGFRRPGRCPRCRSERIQPPRIGAVPR